MHSPSSSFDMAAIAAIAAQGRAQIASSATITPSGVLATPTAAAGPNLMSPPSSVASASSSTSAADFSYPARSDGYDVYAEIGSGAFSTVYRGSVKETGESVAIKVIDLDLFNTNWDEIRREIMIMSTLQHPNVVKLKTAFVDNQDLWIVLALCTAGSCASIIKQLRTASSCPTRIHSGGLWDRRPMIERLVARVHEAATKRHRSLLSCPQPL